MKSRLNLFLRCFGVIAIFLWTLSSAVLAQDANQESQNYTKINFGIISSHPVRLSGNTPVSKQGLYGVGAGYLFGINVTHNNLPLFVEVGPEISYLGRTEEIDVWFEDVQTSHDEYHLQLLSLGSPINLTYLCRLTKALHLAPSAGLNAKCNLLYRTKSKNEKTDYFDRGAKRFQLGWNVGCGVHFHRFCLDIKYTADLTPVVSMDDDKAGYSGLELGIGLKFY